MAKLYIDKFCKIIMEYEGAKYQWTGEQYVINVNPMLTWQEEHEPFYQQSRLTIDCRIVPDLDTVSEDKTISDAHRLAWSVINGDTQAALLLADEVLMSYHKEK